MTQDAEILKELRAFNRNVEWLKVQALRSAPAEKWGSYEDAAKILPRSKHWFQMHRTTSKINNRELGAGVDWRRVGNRIEYRLAAIENLKNAITQ
jgi:hypothetical protein